MANYAEIAVAGQAVADADVQTRARFIGRTYSHLLGAVAAFVGLEVLYFQTGAAESIFRAMMGVSWLLVLGAFTLVSWFASRAAAVAESKVTQYAALGAYVLIESLIFVPLLVFANHKAPGVIASASLVTGLGFVGLTAIAFITRKDFSFLRGLLMWGGVGALLAIVGGAVFGFQLGTWFTVGMIVFAGAAILYDTSNILQHYPSDRYVSASLALFASVMLLLWYVMRFFLSRK